VDLPSTANAPLARGAQFVGKLAHFRLHALIPLDIVTAKPVTQAWVPDAQA